MTCVQEIDDNIWSQLGMLVQNSIGAQGPTVDEQDERFPVNRWIRFDVQLNDQN